MHLNHLRNWNGIGVIVGLSDRRTQTTLTLECLVPGKTSTGQQFKENGLQRFSMYE